MASVLEQQRDIPGQERGARHQASDKGARQPGPLRAPLTGTHGNLPLILWESVWGKKAKAGELGGCDLMPDWGHPDPAGALLPPGEKAASPRGTPSSSFARGGTVAPAHTASRPAPLVPPGKCPVNPASPVQSLAAPRQPAPFATSPVTPFLSHCSPIHRAGIECVCACWGAQQGRGRQLPPSFVFLRKDTSSLRGRGAHLLLLQTRQATASVKTACL